MCPRLPIEYTRLNARNIEWDPRRGYAVGLIKAILGLNARRRIGLQSNHALILTVLGVPHFPSYWHTPDGIFLCSLPLLIGKTAFA